jgi:ubiquinone/menaquinone biosynthesis C-methylase UbiE
MTARVRPRDRRSSAVRNRRAWDRDSRAYDRRNRRDLGAADGRAWGFWRIPESRARWLGPVRGRRVLELGCGAARWSIGLRRQGAWVVGIDQSMAQLAQGRELVARAHVRLPLVRGNAERLPFRDATFDLVFCDWGALTFGDSRQCVPEAARVLRPGGRLVFATGTRFGVITLDPRSDRWTRRLRQPYFGSIRVRVGPMIESRPTAAQWVDLFSQSGLVVERLSETQPPPGARSSYLSARDTAWARRWPAEYIWRVRKR